ncbi:flagellar protein FlaG [Sulfurimonas marina]|uniref:Flagellar protein FlaG n=1 Tax=Sulfurimonas marina TaxID=2590551 RepID=A0A7M1AU35_9BACT|nr:flagellar protein FlaG [Sulfurimonas marina]QOP40929.1 flagellar protein FlaG [Sulfurimonas marina]
MDGIANVAKQQQTQMGAQELQGRSIEQNQSTQLQQQDIVKEVQQDTVDSAKKLNSKEDVEKLVKQLNEALAPISTNIKFGVDSQDIFYVSVIEAKSNRMIRRFPAEDAQIVLPKMQEVNGILFDSKG